jgi:hypothetical protein
VLADHKRRGKRFVPPLASLVTKGGEISWVERVIPELLWLSLLERTHGAKQGAALAVRLAQTAAASARRHKRSWFALISTFASLNNRNWSRVRKDLALSGELFPIQTAVKPLLLYGGFPMAGLFAAASREGRPDDLGATRSAVAALLDKTSVEATRAQAFAVYILGIQGLLHFEPDSPFARFPKIQDYPDTEESQMLASFVRSGILAFFAMRQDDLRWAESFWDQNLTLAPCEHAPKTTA